MKTKILPPTNENIEYAARILKEGGLVAVPTETVYGLAANALDKTAVNNIFKVKKRPADNPLIVHISSINEIPDSINIPEPAQKLMDAFWPGPLSVVLPKPPEIPDIVTAGLDSAAFRVPSNPVALRIIKSAGVPLAAPSANSSGRPSPTSAEHTAQDIGGKIPLIIDGGHCTVGIESTVVRIQNNKVHILRPGMITVQMMEELGIDTAECAGIADITGINNTKENFKNKDPMDPRPRSPGIKHRHYSPNAEVILVKSNKHNKPALEAFIAYVKEHGGDRVFAMVYEGEQNMVENAKAVVFGKRSNPKSLAHSFYSCLREVDNQNGKTLYIRCLDEKEMGSAVYDRITRAANNKTVYI